MSRPINPKHTQALMDLLNHAPYFSLLGMEFQAMEPGYCRLLLPLSYPRHGYFRRILCNILGTLMENGEMTDDIQAVGEVVKDICYRNATAWFGVDG